MELQEQRRSEDCSAGLDDSLLINALWIERICGPIGLIKPSSHFDCQTCLIHCDPS